MTSGRIRTILFFCIIISFLAATAGAQDKPDIGRYFDGERMDYNIAYWFFEKAAWGYMEFKKLSDEPLRYEAVLYAETRGVAGVLTFFQRNVYRSVMEVIEDGKRLRPLNFEQLVLKSGWSERTVHQFDYTQNHYTKSVYRQSSREEFEESPIPAGVIYEDALSAFYNLRYGTYGEAEKGRIFMIRTYPTTGGFNFFKVEVARPEVEVKMRKKWKVTQGEWLAILTVPKELFGTREGLVQAWLSSKGYVPLVATVEDALFFGDMRGTLIKRSFNRPQVGSK